MFCLKLLFLFDVDGGFETRFDFFMPYITREDKEFMLVSGSSVGSELILAIKHGFRNVVGTEVSDYYIPIANIMTEGIKAETLLYDGMKLPFESDRFSMIQSCHIIEHTKDPLEYLKEHIRALKSGGLFFIEFPDRYYSTELHTGTKSFEKYPEVIRNTVLTLLSKSPFVSADNKRRYLSVKETLQQISIKDIKKWLTSLNVSYELISDQNPAPGIKRLLLRIRK